MLSSKARKSTNFTKWIVSKSNLRWLRNILPKHEQNYLENLAKFSESHPCEDVYLKFHIIDDDVKTLYTLSFDPAICKLNLNFENRFLQGSSARQAKSVRAT